MLCWCVFTLGRVAVSIWERVARAGIRRLAGRRERFSRVLDSHARTEHEHEASVCMCVLGTAAGSLSRVLPVLLERENDVDS